MSDVLMPSSDGGGKAREWTLVREAQYVEGRVFSGPDVDEPLVVVEKEWADRQLAEALDVIEKAAGDHSMAFQHERDELRLAARQLLCEHGRISDDS